jgi:hypothetical protein
MSEEPTVRSNYHHGNLRQVVIDATLALVEEGGFENVNLREAFLKQDRTIDRRSGRGDAVLSQRNCQ